MKNANTLCKQNYPVDKTLFGDPAELARTTLSWRQLITAMHLRCDAHVVEILTHHPELARQKGHFGGSALMHCETPGSLAALLPMSDPLARDDDSCTALMHCAASGYFECAAALAECAQINAADRFGMSALMLCARENQPRIARLLAPIADHGLRDKRYGQSALDYAAYGAHFECIQALLPHAPTGICHRGMDPLMHLCSFEYDKPRRLVCAKLLSQSVSAQNYDGEGRSALIIAALSGMWSVCEHLAPISNMSQRDDCGKTIWDYAHPTNPLAGILAKAESFKIDASCALPPAAEPKKIRI